MSNITAIGLCVTIFAASTAAGSVAMMITDILDERKERRKAMRKPSRCYISGKISGTNDYIARFRLYEEKLKEMGWTVVNPAKVNGEMPEDMSYEEYMVMCETMMSLCGAIFMMPGWEDSTGARYEKEYAKIHKMKIFYVDDIEAAR